MIYRHQTVAGMDMMEIERQARALQAQAMRDMFRALGRSISALFGRSAPAKNNTVGTAAPTSA
ncbi:RSP_7527 family protein [Pararhodobacter oceanensis]|uniref:RSP_7527 family protein n=1 Tax=Pararhodobacter oceanensis TaxID=2172121 RepID=UPI003A8CD56F